MNRLDDDGRKGIHFFISSQLLIEVSCTKAIVLWSAYYHETVVSDYLRLTDYGTHLGRVLLTVQ